MAAVIHVTFRQAPGNYVWVWLWKRVSAVGGDKHVRISRDAGIVKLLLVEDDTADAGFLRSSLADGPRLVANLVQVDCLSAALTLLRDRTFDAVLLDLSLPDACDEACVRAVRQASPTTPIVALGGDDSEAYGVRVLDAGVQDYLVKWDRDGKAIQRAIRYAIERKRSELRLQHLATHDPLTAIPNHHYFMQYLAKAVGRARRNGTMLGLVFLDLDRLSGVNETLGHRFGDLLLVAAAERIVRAVRIGDVTARMGGDEFAVVLEDLPDFYAAEAVARNLIEVLSEPYLLDGHAVSATASIGLTIFPNDRGDPQTLIRNADTAMYQAKTAGRNGFKFFTESMHRTILRKHEVAQDIGLGLAAEEFYLLYQPQVRLADQSMAGAEALLRWQRRDGTVQLPNDFIGIAEELGQIIPLGRWVARTACLQSLAWQKAGYRPGRVALKISPRQLLHAGFCEELENLIAERQIDPDLIELEVTETALVRDARGARRTLNILKNLGFSLAIDNFGTGHWPLDALRTFPFDSVKLARSFVKDIGLNRHGPAICRAILSIADSLDLDTMAQGIETEEQLNFLMVHGCRRGQGFYLCEPLTAADLGARLELALADSPQPRRISPQ